MIRCCHRLSCHRLIRYLSLLFACWPAVGVSADTFLDNFSSVSYSNQHGSQNWSSNWQESGDNNSPSSGDILIFFNELLLKDDNNSISRSADLSLYTSATLSFSYSESGFDNSNDWVEIQVRTGSGSWTALQRFAGNFGSASFTQDISAYIAADTQIRFLTSSGLGNFDGFYADGVLISASPDGGGGGAPACTAVFTDAVQSHSGSGVITLGNGVTITGSDGVLDSAQTIVGGATACGGSACTASGSAAASGSVTVQTGSGGDILSVANNGSITVDASVGNDFGWVSIGNNATVTFAGAATDYYFPGASSTGSGAIISLSSGNYWYANFHGFSSGNVVTVNDGGTVRIYVNGQLDINGNLNADGAGTVFIYATGRVQIGNGVTVNAYIYTENNVYLGNNAVLTGSVSAADVILNNNSTVNYVAVTSSADPGALCDIIAPPVAVAEYRFDETSWNGTPGEVTDSSANALHGRALDGAYTANTTPDPAINTDPGTCRYGEFDYSAVEVSDNALLDLNTAVTITAWIRHTPPWLNWVDDVVVTKGNASQNYRLSINTSNRVEFDWGSYTLQSTASVADDAWTHLAVTYANGSQAIYINGSLDRSATRTDSLAANNDSLVIGRISSGLFGSGFSGQIDEVRIYDSALSAAQVTTVYQETHPCSLVAAVDHYSIVAAADALTCEPLSVTITGHDASHAAFAPGNGTTISLSTSDGLGRWVLPASSSGSLLDNGGGNASYTFVDNAAVVLSLSHPTIASGVSINVNAAASPNEDAAEDPAINFHDSGFRFVDASDNSIGMQTAGLTSGTYYLQAVRSDDVTQQCVAAFPDPATVNVELGVECLNPAGCNAATPGIVMTIGYDSSGTQTTTNIELSDDNNGSGVDAYTTLAMDFAANARAPLTLNYWDAGQIELHARYEILDDDGVGLGNYMLGSSIFRVKPAGICVQSTDALAACLSANTSCSVLRTAGLLPPANQFNLQISGRAWGGAPETNSEFCNNNLTPNYVSFEPISLTSAVVEPSGGENGNLLVVSASISSGGLVDINQAIDEVGVFTFTADQHNYFTETIAASTSANIGRIVPDHFVITPISVENRTDPETQAACGGTFTFLDEQLTLNFSISAQNSENATTQNYTGDFALLNGTPGTGDLTGTATDNINLVVADGSVGYYHGERLTGVNPSINISNGEQTAALVFEMNRSPLGSYLAEAPFTNVKLGLNAVDSDGVSTQGGALVVTMNSTPVTFTQIGTTTFYYGRVVVENAYGSELRPLPMWAHTEYCSAVDATPVCTNWVDLNRSESDDTCTRLSIAPPSPDTTLADYWDGGTSYSAGTHALFRVNDLAMQRGGGSWRLNYVGPSSSVMVPALGSSTLETYHPYLILKQGEASFGTYRGNDRIIYWQELVQ